MSDNPSQEADAMEPSSKIPSPGVVQVADDSNGSLALLQRPSRDRHEPFTQVGCEVDHSKAAAASTPSHSSTLTVESSPIIKNDQASDDRFALPHATSPLPSSPSNTVPELQPLQASPVLVDSSTAQPSADQTESSDLGTVLVVWNHDGTYRSPNPAQMAIPYLEGAPEGQLPLPNSISPVLSSPLHGTSELHPHQALPVQMDSAAAQRSTALTGSSGVQAALVSWGPNTPYRSRVAVQPECRNLDNPQATRDLLGAGRFTPSQRNPRYVFTYRYEPTKMEDRFIGNAQDKIKIELVSKTNTMTNVMGLRIAPKQRQAAYEPYRRVRHNVCQSLSLSMSRRSEATMQPDTDDIFEAVLDTMIQTWTFHYDKLITTYNRDMRRNVVQEVRERAKMTKSSVMDDLADWEFNEAKTAQGQLVFESRADRHIRRGVRDMHIVEDPRDVFVPKDEANGQSDDATENTEPPSRSVTTEPVQAVTLPAITVTLSSPTHSPVVRPPVYHAPRFERTKAQLSNYIRPEGPRRFIPSRASGEVLRLHRHEARDRSLSCSYHDPLPSTTPVYWSEQHGKLQPIYHPPDGALDSEHDADGTSASSPTPTQLVLPTFDFKTKPATISQEETTSPSPSPSLTQTTLEPTGLVRSTPASPSREKTVPVTPKRKRSQELDFGPFSALRPYTGRPFFGATKEPWTEPRRPITRSRIAQGSQHTSSSSISPKKRTLSSSLAVDDANRSELYPISERVIGKMGRHHVFAPTETPPASPTARHSSPSKRLKTSGDAQDVKKESDDEDDNYVVPQRSEDDGAVFGDGDTIIVRTH